MLQKVGRLVIAAVDVLLGEAAVVLFCWGAFFGTIVDPHGKYPLASNSLAVYFLSVGVFLAAAGLFHIGYSVFDPDPSLSESAGMLFILLSPCRSRSASVGLCSVDSGLSEG